MNDLFLGWDVGAWNCDRNRLSRDALCALALDGELAIIGRPWRGNLRDVLVGGDGQSPVRALLEKVGLRLEAASHVTIAIDAPLAWPKRMIDLVTRGEVVDVPPEADRNPYLFRAQDLDLFPRGCRPLSTVRDMIGSQSTKAIHFLRRAQLVASEPGTWRDAGGSVAVLETYPAAVNDGKLELLSDQLLAAARVAHAAELRSQASRKDVRDAIICALVAWLHRREHHRLLSPQDRSKHDEGWIWLPATAGTPA